MSKELTPLEALEKAKMDMNYHRKYECHYYYPKREREEYFSIIETTLKEYEKLLSYEITYNNLIEIIIVLVTGYGIKTGDQLISLLKGKEEL